MPQTVDVVFVSGLEAGYRVPDHVTSAGLDRRLAVVQDSYVRGATDMVFDEPLWRCLVDFVRGSDDHAAVSVSQDGRVIRNSPDGTELDIEAFLEMWNAQAEDDWNPPAVVVSRREGRIVLCMVREHWNRVGGPMPYHDSYTFSIFSDRDLSQEIPRFLTSRNDAGRRRLAEQVIQAK